MKITVYRRRDKHYASRSSTNGDTQFPSDVEVIFVLTGEDLSELDERAKIEARRRGVGLVVNLDEQSQKGP